LPVTVARFEVSVACSAMSPSAAALSIACCSANAVSRSRRAALST
jgi:hypothetical protein